MAKGRKSSIQKTELVLSHLRGESLEEISRKHNVSLHDLKEWIETFKQAGQLSLKSKPQSIENYELDEAKRIIANQVITIEILKKRNQLIDKRNKK